MSANVINNEILSAISGTSTLDTASSLTLTADSSEIIRALSLGIAGSGTVAVQVTAMGNVISNKVLATISGPGTNVHAAGDVILKAQDVAPGILTGWNLGNNAQNKADVNASLSDPLFDPTANIMAVNISVAASGTVAVNAAFTGNVIANTIKADILDHATVHSTGGKVDLEAVSKAGIIGITVGVAGSGTVAVNATGFGNVITNTVDASILGGSTVTAAGLIHQTAIDRSTIRSLGISVAGSGAVSVGALIGANVITNSITALVSGSTVSSGSTLNLSAESGASVISFSTGVAGSGAVSVLVSLSGNVITNTMKAAVVNDGAVSDVHSGGAVSISAKDTSTIDAIAIGVSGTGGVAVGVALAANVISNSVEATITGSTLDTGAALAIIAQESAIIRTLAIGVSGSGGVAVQVTAMGNSITNKSLATISNSTVTAAGDISLSAKDVAPVIIPAWAVPADKQATINSSLSGSPL